MPTEPCRRLALSMRVVQTREYVEARDCIAQDWSRFLATVLPEAAWLAMPNDPDRVVPLMKAWAIDGLILTGGNDIGEHAGKDASDRAMLDYALRCGLPVLGGAVGVGQPARGQRRGGEAKAQAQPLRPGAVADLGQQRRQPAKQLQAAADFEQQGVGWGEADRRGEVAGPAGQRFERGEFAFTLAFMRAQAGQQGEGVGQALAGADAGCSRRGVGRHDALLRNGDRRRRQGQHLDGETEKMNRQPLHGSGPSGDVRLPGHRRGRANTAHQARPRQRSLDGKADRLGQRRAATLEDVDLHAGVVAAQREAQRSG